MGPFYDAVVVGFDDGNRASGDPAAGQAHLRMQLCL